MLSHITFTPGLTVMENNGKGRKQCHLLTWSPDSRWSYHLIGKVEAFNLLQSLFTLDPSTSTKSLQFSTSVGKNKTCTQLFPASILMWFYLVLSLDIFVSQQKDFVSHHVTSLLFIVLSEKRCLMVASENKELLLLHCLVKVVRKPFSFGRCFIFKRVWLKFSLFVKAKLLFFNIKEKGFVSVEYVCFNDAERHSPTGFFINVRQEVKFYTLPRNICGGRLNWHPCAETSGRRVTSPVRRTTLAHLWLRIIAFSATDELPAAPLSCPLSYKGPICQRLSAPTLTAFYKHNPF